MVSVHLWIIVVAWIVIGVMFGTASYYWRSRSDSGGWLTNVVFGVLGALIGGIAAAIVASRVGNWPSHWAAAGALGSVLLWRLYHARPRRD